MDRTRKKKLLLLTTTICLLSEAKRRKNVHVWLETGLLVDSSTSLEILYVKCSLRIKLSSVVYFAWMSQVTSRSFNTEISKFRAT